MIRMDKRAHVHVYGRVQGVYFRQETVQRALERGVNGWVRNNRDGSVEAVFEGDGPMVDELVDWCDRGPAMARVESVVVEWEKPAGEDLGFSISRGG